MVYTIMILASRKPTITHSEFKTRYEQHMKLVAQLCGNAAPLKHTRRYPKHEGPDDKPILLAGNAETVPCHDVVVEMVFEDESAFGRFCQALDTPDVKAAIEADEEGFWERSRMAVFAVGEVMEWKP